MWSLQINLRGISIFVMLSFLNKIQGMSFHIFGDSLFTSSVLQCFLHAVLHIFKSFWGFHFSFSFLWLLWLRYFLSYQLYCFLNKIQLFYKLILSPATLLNIHSASNSFSADSLGLCKYITIRNVFVFLFGKFMLLFHSLILLWYINMINGFEMSPSCPWFIT